MAKWKQMENNMVCVQLVDDHAVVREGLRIVLESHPNIRVSVESASGEEGYAHYFVEHPDVMVLDIAMPGEGGLSMLHRLIKRDPEAKVLVLSMYDDELIAIKAIEAGARGFVSKGASPGLILEAVRKVAEGEVFIENRVARKMALHHANKGRGLNSLTKREFEVFHLLAGGKSVQNISDTLHLSSKTVGTHRTRIMAKLGCKNVAELARIAIRHGVIQA